MAANDQSTAHSDKFDLLELLSTSRENADAAGPAPSRPLSVGEPEDSPNGEDLAPLPLPHAPYKAHSRIANRPVPTLFLLPKGMLPDGYSYGCFERVYLEEASTPGAGPVLVVRFGGSVVTEAVIEGRNLLPLATYIGRHLVHWIWELPAGRQVPEDAATVVRSIIFRTVAG